MHCPQCKTENPEFKTVESGDYLITACNADVILHTERCANCSHFSSMHRHEGRCNECKCPGFKPIPDEMKKCGVILGVQFKQT